MSTAAPNQKESETQRVRGLVDRRCLERCVGYGGGLRRDRYLVEVVEGSRRVQI